MDINEKMIEAPAMFKLSYGLFVLSAKDSAENNGCIINTVMQVTDSPKRIVIAVNKSNHTHDMIAKSREFNVSVLTEDTPFDYFKRFGFQSGRDVNKFDGFDAIGVSENGLFYITEHTNSFMSAKVTEIIDCGTHSLFVADVTEAKVLSDGKSVTYAYYFEHIKPGVKKSDKKKYVCQICGYVYEGDELPEDYICPLCKHGAEFFELVG